MKKLLALVLALVMTLGLATVGANAADFKDESSIEYNEAVNVMNGIGVIQGDDNGNFNPKGTLTREQAAKIVAYMVLGQKGADSLSASAAPYSDVAADRWSAGAISYCTTEGIIAGLGDGTFNPTGLLTGHQFAKMLLVALGYNPTYENLVNDKDWAINTAKLAVAAGLEDDLSIVMSQDISRDQAAKMAFNTLTADMVAYENPINVKTSDGTEVIVKADRYKVDDLRGAKNLYDGRDEDNDVRDVDKFCEVYFPDLKLVDTGKNDFSEPLNQWTFKNTTISEEAKEADKVLVGGVTYEDLYNAAGSAAMENLNSIAIYVDGKEIASDNDKNKSKSSDIDVVIDYDSDHGNKPIMKSWAKDLDEDLCWDSFSKTYTASKVGKTAPTGNGTITSVFVDRNTNKTYDVNINVKHIYAGKVTSVTEASGNAARKVTITGKTLPTQTINGVSLDADFETNQFKKDDIVYYTAATNTAGDANAKIQSMALATLVSGVELTKTTTQQLKVNKTVLTAGGKDYKLNVNVRVESEIGADAVQTLIDSAGDKFDLYLDSNGLVVFAEKTEEELNLNNYLVLTRGNIAGGTGSNPVADAITLAGNKLTNVNITKYDGDTLSDWSKIELYKVYKYTVKGSDYELDKVGSSYDTARVANVNYTAGTARFDNVNGIITGSTKLYVYDMTDSGVKTYTGVNNFPKITQSNATKADKNDDLIGGKCLLEEDTANTKSYDAIDKAHYANKLNTNGSDKATTDNTVLNGTYTNAVMALTKNGNILAAVVVHNSTIATDDAKVVLSNVSTSTKADDIIYVANKNYTTSKSGDDTVWTFDVIKDGKVTTVSTTKDTVMEKLRADQELFLIDSYDGEYVESVTARPANGTAKNLQTVTGTSDKWGRTDVKDELNGGVYSVTIDVASGTFKMEGNDEEGNAKTLAAYATDSKTKFFEIATGGKVTELDADSFGYDSITKGEISVVYDTDDNVATFIFFQKV